MYIYINILIYKLLGAAEIFAASTPVRMKNNVQYYVCIS